MKFPAKLILFGVIILPVFFFWHRPARPSPASAATALSAGLTSETAGTSKVVNPLRHTLGAIRWKLHDWRESMADHPDDEAEHDRLMQELLALVTDENAAAIVQSLSAADLNTPFGIAVLHHWMQVDILAASNWISTNPDTTSGETRAVAEDWVRNRAGLQDFLDQLPAGDWKQNFISDLGAGLSVKDPAVAAQFALQLNSGPARLNLLQSVACNWISADPEAASKWLSGVSDPALRESLEVSAIQSYAVTDPAQAADLLVSDVKSGHLLRDGVLNILRTWAAQNPAAAAGWVSQFPEGEVKAAAISVVFGYWQHADINAATAWVQNSSGVPAGAIN